MSSAINTAPNSSCWLQTLFCPYNITDFNLSVSELLSPLQSFVQFLLVVYFSCSVEGIYNRISNTQQITDSKVKQLSDRLSHDDFSSPVYDPHKLSKAMKSRYDGIVGIIRIISFLMMAVAALFLLSSGMGNVSQFFGKIASVYFVNIKVYLWINLLALILIFSITYALKNTDLKAVKKIYNELSRTGKDSMYLIEKCTSMNACSEKTRSYYLDHIRGGENENSPDWFDEYRQKCISNVINQAIEELETNPISWFIKNKKKHSLSK